MGVHDNHRERVFKKFAKNGFSGLEEHEKLEIMLFFSIPRVNTNTIAHELLNKYGTIANVMDAPVYELEKFEHVTNRTAFLFKMIKEAAATYEIEKEADKTYMTLPEEFGSYFQLYFSNADVEKMAVMCLDSRGKKIKVDFVSEGNVSRVSVNFSKILEMVFNSKTTEVVIAHNHPGNIVTPSQEDIEVTKNIKEFLKNIGVILKDHIIVTRDDYFSMASCDLYSEIFIG